MRYLVAISFALLVFAGAAAWVVEAEPDWYLRSRYPLEYEHVIRAYAGERNLDPSLVAAVVYAESRFDPNVRSTAGAVGLMQVLPETGEFIAKSTGGTDFVEADLRDPDINVRYGTWLLEYLRTRYDGDVETALAAYHAGPANVTSGAVPEWGSSSRRPARTSTRCCASSRCTRRRTGAIWAYSVAQQREHESRARELLAAGAHQSQAVQDEVHERAELLGLDVVAELALALGILDALAVRRSDRLLPLLDPPTELRVGAGAAKQLEVDREPGRVELDDFAHDGFEAFVDPDLRHPPRVADSELDEEVLLGGEVIEDRAAREADGLLELDDGRA